MLHYLPPTGDTATPDSRISHPSAPPREPHSRRLRASGAACTRKLAFVRRRVRRRVRGFGRNAHMPSLQQPCQVGRRLVSSIPLQPPCPTSSGPQRCRLCRSVDSGLVHSQSLKTPPWSVVTLALTTVAQAPASPTFVLAAAVYRRQLRLLQPCLCSHQVLAAHDDYTYLDFVKLLCQDLPRTRTRVCPRLPTHTTRHTNAAVSTDLDACPSNFRSFIEPLERWRAARNRPKNSVPLPCSHHHARHGITRYADGELVFRGQYSSSPSCS